MQRSKRGSGDQQQQNRKARERPPSVMAIVPTIAIVAVIAIGPRVIRRTVIVRTAAVIIRIVAIAIVRPRTIIVGPRRDGADSKPADDGTGNPPAIRVSFGLAGHRKRRQANARRRCNRYKFPFHVSTLFSERLLLKVYRDIDLGQ